MLSISKSPKATTEMMSKCSWESVSDGSFTVITLKLQARVLVRVYAFCRCVKKRFVLWPWVSKTCWNNCVTWEMHSILHLDNVTNQTGYLSFSKWNFQGLPWWSVVRIHLAVQWDSGSVADRRTKTPNTKGQLSFHATATEPQSHN